MTIRHSLQIASFYILLVSIPGIVWSQTGPEQSPATPGQIASSDLVEYPASYFERFKPQTALDMVQQVPGFKLEESEEGPRGFANATGNLLINDQRPSAKADLPSAILSRIPVNNVERIELIRGQVRGIDMRGQSALINVVLRTDTPAAVKWETAILRPAKHGPLTPSISLSLTDQWNAIEYNAGLQMFKNAYGRTGLDRLLDRNGVLTENRYDDRENRVRELKANLNAVTTLGEDTLVKLNSVLTHEKRMQFLSSDRDPVAAGTPSRIETFDDNLDKPAIEIGLDAERPLANNLVGKAIILFARGDEGTYRTQRVLDINGRQTSFRLAEGNGLSTELIARLEFDWSAWEDHTLQMNFERAYNGLDRTLVSTLDSGAGPIPLSVPGANSVVKEVRWDALLQDTWSLDDLELDMGVGGEWSTITQTGDAEQERSFFYLKPRGIVTWSPEQGVQTRFRVAREVSQLVLTEFVSATLFEDDDLALGNPDIQPDATWVAEVIHERRFGSIGVIRLKVFHHWIANVLDLLPITPTFEVPGNIGSGKRWGAEVATTVPLEWLGLVGSRLEIKTRWQDSTVVDPVTGEDRILSGPAGDYPILYDVDNRFGLSLDYRQDFEASRVAWGWTVISRAERELFRVNELEVNNEAVELGAFIETTRWLGMRVRLSAQNLLNSTHARDRTVFTGERYLSAIRFIELRKRDRDRAATLTFSGVF